jgi:hypothetical protein
MVFYIDINQMYLIMVQHLSIQGNNNKNEFLHNRMFLVGFVNNYPV